MIQFSTSELDDTLIQASATDESKAEMRQRMAQVLAILQESKRATAALAVASAKIESRGPGSIKEHMEQTIAAFIIVTLKLVESRENAKSEIPELERLFNLEG